MLELKNIIKNYKVGDDEVRALKGVTLTFRENEMVSILGQSGCGKTTLLNIVGGLDRYTDGDLVINGRSTKDFKPSDWDAYRNRRIGFVFQSYNLIPHLTVLGNVELALTLSGVKKNERKRRAVEALRLVGLEGEIKKRPNQMSGGQMQRVAIARAIVNNPDIILADEPTGALDSNTSVQVMEILKEIAKDRLVIMVTHNRELAETYSTRIISMLDGLVTDDTAPVEENVVADGAIESTESEPAGEKIAPAAEPQESEKARQKRHKKEQKAITKSNKAAMKHTSMNFLTAFGLSWRNLITKKGRTIATSIAGSIGIIGVALVLALSNGFNGYISDMQTSMLSSYPVTVTQMTADLDSMMAAMDGSRPKLEQFPDGNKLVINAGTGMMTFHYNRITPEYLDFIDNMPDGLVLDVTRDYTKSKVLLSSNMTTVGGGTYGRISVEGDMVSEMMGMSSSPFQQLLDNKDYVLSQYDVLAGSYPTAADEIAVVIGSDNSINKSTLTDVGLKIPDNLDDATLDDLLTEDQVLKLVFNDQWFTKTANGMYKSFNESEATQEQWKALYDNPNNLTLRVVGVMRIKESAALAMYNNGLVYTPALNRLFIENCKASEVGRAQIANTEISVSDAFNMMSGQSGAGSSAGMRFDKIIEFMGGSFNGITLTKEDLYEMACQSVGASDIPSALNFYPIDFDKKTDMLAYLDIYNLWREPADRIIALDAASIVTSAVSQMIDIISYVLIAFAAISLVVSSVMISIITYASVAERIKEIGVLRAVGARKVDVMRVFNAETVIIGLAAGLIGVLVTFILSFPLSSLFISISAGAVHTSLVSLSWWHAILLVGISVLLTFLAGMLPSMSAAKRDPVVALRSE